MKPQTIVYDADVPYAEATVGNLANSEAIIACSEGDKLVELEAYEEMLKEGEKAAMFHTGTSLIMYMKTMLVLCRAAIIERNENGA